MTATGNTTPKPHEDDPIKALFDYASRWATIWGFIALCLWLEHQVLNLLDIESGSIQVAILLVSTPAIFLMTVTRIEKAPKARLILGPLRRDLGRCGLAWSLSSRQPQRRFLRERPSRWRRACLLKNGGL